MCRESLREFEEANRERNASVAMAVGEQLLGIMTLQRGAGTEAAAAMRLFESAAARIPESHQAQHLVELANMSRALADSTMIRSTEIEAQLMHAIAARPDDDLAIGNLNQFYRVLGDVGRLRQLEGFEIPRGELEARLRDFKRED
jgi:hypothetical protein